MELVRDIGLALRIFLFAAAVPWLMRLPIRRLEEQVKFVSPLGCEDKLRARKVVRFTGAACSALRPFVDRPCLVRGLTLYYFLCRAGVNVSLVFGIGRMGEVYAGHCWLVKDDQPYLEAVDPREFFTPMYTFHRDPASERSHHSDLYVPG